MNHWKKKNKIYLLVLILLGITIGYAALNANLSIEGTSNISNATWDIHFDHLNETSGGVTPNSTTSINAVGNTVTYNITLNKPGDFYEFTVDAVNAGSIDGMIETITSTLNGNPITTLPNYLNYSVTYSDGVTIAPNHLLAASSSETYKIRVEFDPEVEEEDLPDTNQTLSFVFGVNYIQANSNAIEVPHPALPESFAGDDWETIVGAVQSGNTSAYHVGDTKTVELGNSLGTHTLRIANTNTPLECSTAGFSQTACGFVLEFEDLIIENVMNLTDTNVGGWPASNMRTHLNTDVYNALPEVLRNAIINTTVVSGHGCYNYDEGNDECLDTGSEANFTSIDKLYLLSTHEIWEDVDGNTSDGIDYYDTAYNNTRQLDYYAGLNVTTSNYSGIIKQYDNLFYDFWWLRSAYSHSISRFYYVNDEGYWSTTVAGNTYSFSPAFRIG